MASAPRLGRVRSTPKDFPPEHRPPRPADRAAPIEARDYVPVQNAYGGFVYAGGTMAFTAG